MVSLEAFKEYMQQFVGTAELIAIKKKYSETDEEEKMKTELKKLCEKKWNNNAKGVGDSIQAGKDKGKQSRRAETQKENFMKVMTKDIDSLERSGFFEDFKEPIRDKTFEYIPERSVSDRVKRQLEGIAPPENKEDIIKNLTHSEPGELSAYSRKDLEHRNIDELGALWRAEKGKKITSQSQKRRYETHTMYYSKK